MLESCSTSSETTKCHNLHHDEPKINIGESKIPAFEISWIHLSSARLKACGLDMGSPGFQCQVAQLGLSAKPFEPSAPL